MWFVYMIRCSDNSLYTGITTDIQRRMVEHNSDTKLGAKYSRARQPTVLVYMETAVDRSSALKREAAIKKLSKSDKERLISP